MKKIKLSLAALTLVLAIAGTTTVNATKSKDATDPCSSVDPDGTLCTDEWPQACCFDTDQQRVINQKLPKPF
jgi:hypothetical protein